MIVQFPALTNFNDSDGNPILKTVTVDTTQRKIDFENPQNTLTRFICQYKTDHPNWANEFNNVEFYQYFEDVEGQKTAFKPVIIRSSKEDFTNFQNLDLGPITGLYGELEGKVFLNTQLENLRRFFPESIACFRAEYNWAFFQPIMALFETSEESITVNVKTPTDGSFEYSIDGGVNWQASNLFLGLTSGEYTVQIRNNNDAVAPIKSYSIQV